MAAVERRHADGGDGERRFDANFASPAYLIETVVCYTSSRNCGVAEPIVRCHVDAATARCAAASQFARSQ
jgi:hypothetical protein